ATLTLELSPETLPVRLDPVALELALLALLRDAAGAAPGPRSVVVRTAARVIDGGGDRQTVELSVTDSRCATPRICRRSIASSPAAAGRLRLRRTRRPRSAWCFPGRRGRRAASYRDGVTDAFPTLARHGRPPGLAEGQPEDMPCAGHPRRLPYAVSVT